MVAATDERFVGEQGLWWARCALAHTIGGSVLLERAEGGSKVEQTRPVVPRPLTLRLLLPLPLVDRSDFDKQRSATSLDVIVALQVQGEVYRDQLEVRRPSTPPPPGPARNGQR